MPETEIGAAAARPTWHVIDRIDLLAYLQPDRTDLLSAAPLTSSKKAREQVTRARERQAARFKDDGVILNAHMDAGMLERHVRLDGKGEAMLGRARASGLLSARGQHRVLRVARTIADLNGSERVSARDLGGALALRSEAGLADSRAA
jgi:magnesium chelatase family protein